MAKIKKPMYPPPEIVESLVIKLIITEKKVDAIPIHPPHRIKLSPDVFRISELALTNLRIITTKDQIK